MLVDWIFLLSTKRTRYLYDGDLLVIKETSGNLLKLLPLMQSTVSRWLVEFVVVDKNDDGDKDDNGDNADAIND